MRDCVVKLASAGADAGEGRQLDPDRPFSCRSSCRHHVDEYYLVSSVKHSSMVHMMLRPPRTARLRVCYNIVLFFLLSYTHMRGLAWPRLAVRAWVGARVDEWLREHRALPGERERRLGACSHPHNKHSKQ